MQDYTGWRVRIGLACAAENTVAEPEFAAMSPPGIATCATRVTIADQLDPAELGRAVGCLVRADLHAIIVATDKLLVEDAALEAAIRARLDAAGGAMKIATVADAAMAALNLLGVRRPTIIVPGGPAMAEAVRRCFAARGIAPAGVAAMGLEGDHAAAPLEALYRFACANVAAGSDGLLVAGTEQRSVGAIAALEEDLGMPVVSAVQAAFWHGLRLAGAADAVGGFGRLLQR